MKSADVLNPIVLKELRQGLKSRSFVATFLGLQVLMVVSMLLFFAAVAVDAGDLEFANGFFWFMLGLMLLVFMPLRSFGALHGEIKGNTLEMLFLTRMSSWDIAFGKWLALLLQIGLLVCAVLPYLVIRYFLGSINVTADLIQLGIQVLVSCFLVAIGVGLSSWTLKLLRGLIIFGALTSLYTLPLALYGFSQSGGGAFRFWNILDVGVWIVVSVLMMLYFVEYGASQIAPPAENHSIRKRAIALGVMVLLVVYSVFVEKSASPMLIGYGLLIPVFMDVLCEPVFAIRSLYRPLKRWSLLRFFLYPGWPSSLLFFVLLFAATVPIAAAIEADEEIAKACMVIFNILLFPFFIIRLIPILTRKAFTSYLFLQVANLLVVIFLSIMGEILGIWPDSAVAMFYPPFGMYVLLDDGPDAFTWMMLLVPVTIMLGLSFFKAIRPWRQMEQLAKEVDP